MEKPSSSPEKGGAAISKTTSSTEATTPLTRATSTTETRTTSSASKPSRSVVVAQAWDVISLLLLYRLLNSLCVRTFFQPDEYFQALEPAWDIAFGQGSGAWMTWVGTEPQNRSGRALPQPLAHCLLSVAPFSWTLRAWVNIYSRNGSTSFVLPSILCYLAWRIRL